jgi:hypothetical protein
VAPENFSALTGQDCQEFWRIVERSRGSATTKLVEREEELELLLRRWSKAKAGEGQVVLLSGEPGIGKSRLTSALLECNPSELHTRLRYRHSTRTVRCTRSSERAAGFPHDDTARAKLNKLDVLLAQSLTQRQDAALLAEMLSLPDDGRNPTVEWSPQERRQQTLQALPR